MIGQMHLGASVQPRIAPLRRAALVLGVAAGLLVSCWSPWTMRTKPRTSFRTQPPPSAEERYCARTGEARDGVLYFAQSTTGAEAGVVAARGSTAADPLLDREVAGPRWIGRFHLERRAVLRPLDVGAPGARAGVWEVLAHPNGHVYFTTFSEEAGRVHPQDGRVERFHEAGRGLAGLAPGPDGGVLATRWLGPDGGDGSVLVLAEDGSVRAEHRLAPVPGRRVAARGTAWDPVRREIWVLTELQPTAGAPGRHDAHVPAAGGPGRHDARVLAPDGALLHRIEGPEIQRVVFRADGTGILAEADAQGLWLRVVGPDAAGPPLERGVRIHADEFFEPETDFVGDIRFAPDGRAVAMRWSGRFHLLDPSVPLSLTQRLGRPSQGRFQTGVVHGERVCATLCREVNLVCRDGTGF